MKSQRKTMRGDNFPGEECKESLVRFTREIIGIPSPSGGEAAALARIREEMVKVGWEDVRTDGLGNLYGRIGSGRRVLAIDGHADTVGPGDLREWECDPYAGKLEEGWIWGRGAVDQKGGIAAAVYAAPLIRRFRIEGDYSLFLIVSVQEEGSEGLSWDYIIEEEGFRPEAVVLSEPSDLKIKRGQKGRMEMVVTARGRSAHASCPEKGRNAISAICEAARKVSALDERLRACPGMWSGRATVCRVRSRGASDNSISGLCRMLVDRRFVPGETRESILAEFRELLGGDVEIAIPRYRKRSYTGRLLGGEKFFPAWMLEENHPLLAAAREASVLAWGKEAPVGFWGFSTNGVSIAGRHGIPAIGLGPGEGEMSHCPNERVRIEDLLQASRFYAHLPQTFAELFGGG